MTKTMIDKLDTILFIVQNTRGEWMPEDVMEMYYYIEEELNPFEEENSPVLNLVSNNKEVH